jgi:hypothetical protein
MAKKGSDRKSGDGRPGKQPPQNPNYPSKERGKLSGLKRGNTPKR